jgi:hypothetical protein
MALCPRTVARTELWGAPNLMPVSTPAMAASWFGTCSAGEGLRCASSGKLVGTAVAAGPLSDPPYAAVLAREFDAITPENATKWGELEQVQGTWNFEAADRIFAAAEANDQTIKAHTLVWHIQAPSWIGGQGPGQSFLGKISSGQVLTATAWVKVNTGTHPVRLTIKSTVGGQDTYTSFASAVARSDGWTRITGAATFGWSSEPSTLELYFEGPPAGVNLLVDDFSLRPLTLP